MKFLTVLLPLLIICNGCLYTKGAMLKTSVLNNEADIGGELRLIMYGGNYLEDLETLAFLDIEGDEYEYIPYAPDFFYEIETHIGAEEALHKAKEFIGFHGAYSHYSVKGILNEKGNITGYEIRPYYMPLIYGEPDVLEVYYRSEGNGKVLIYVTLKSSVERIVEGDGFGHLNGGYD